MTLPLDQSGRNHFTNLNKQMIFENKSLKIKSLKLKQACDNGFFNLNFLVYFNVKLIEYELQLTG